MRQGDLFRRSAINYVEIPDLDEAIAPLVALAWIDATPRLELAELFRLCTRVEFSKHDTSPKQAPGLNAGLFNTFGNVAGITTPIVIGYIVKAMRAHSPAHLRSSH